MIVIVDNAEEAKKKAVNVGGGEDDGDGEEKTQGEEEKEGHGPPETAQLTPAPSILLGNPVASARTTPDAESAETVIETKGLNGDARYNAQTLSSQEERLAAVVGMIAVNDGIAAVKKSEIAAVNDELAVYENTLVALRQEQAQLQNALLALRERVLAGAAVDFV